MKAPSRLQLSQGLIWRPFKGPAGREAEIPTGSDADPICSLCFSTLPSQWDIWYSTLSLQLVAQSWPHQQTPTPSHKKI